MAGWPVFQKITPLSPEDWEAIRQQALKDTWEPYQEVVPQKDLLDFPHYTLVSNDDDEHEGYSIIG